MRNKTLASFAIAAALLSAGSVSANIVDEQASTSVQAAQNLETSQDQQAQADTQEPEQSQVAVQVDKPEQADQEPQETDPSSDSSSELAKLTNQLRELTPEALNTDASNEIAKQLVDRIDSLRGYANQGFSFEMTNISYRRVRRDGEVTTESHENSLNVSVLGEQSLVKFLSPARDKGRLILKSGRNMWLYIPGTSKTLRVTPAQRLIGEASNGDVTGTNFGAEYTAQLSKIDANAEQSTVEITLTAVSRSVTYSKIVFTLSLTDLLPKQSEYYSISGKLLKRADYVEFKQFDDQLKIHKMRLFDPVTTDRITWLMFDKYQLEEINPAIFNADSLSRL